MEILLDSIEIGLVSSQPVALRRAKGTQVICTAGTVWLTVAGLRADVVLHAGDCFVVRDHKLAVVEAMAQDPTTGAAGNATIRLRTGCGRLRTWLAQTLVTDRLGAQVKNRMISGACATTVNKQSITVRTASS